MILGHNPHEQPAKVLHHIPAADVADILPPISAVVIPVVLDTDEQLRPTHIQICDEHTVVGVHRHLSLRPRQPTSNQDQSQIGLPRRLGTSIDEVEHRL